MKQLNLNGQEVLKLSMDLDNIKSNLADIFNKVYSKITYCASNLVDEETGKSVLAGNVDKLGMKCMATSNALITYLNVIKEFVDNQVKEYSASTQDAETSINNLISKIESLLGAVESGKIYLNSSSTSNDSSVFTDQTALQRGEKYQDNLPGKLATEQQYQTMDICYNFFKEKGLTEEQIAGILGNACNESGFDTNVVSADGGSFGIFQWLKARQPSEWQNMSEVPIETQLEYAWQEMQGAPCGGNITSVIDELRECTTVKQASDIFSIYFEGSQHLTPREHYSNVIYYYYSQK